MKLAIKNGNVEMARILLDRGAKIEGTEGDCITPIKLATLYGREEIVELLLDRGAWHDGSLISVAIKHSKILKLLLDRQVNANNLAAHDMLLCSAIEKGKTESVGLLLDYCGAIRVNDEKYLLHCAIKRGDREIVKLLLSRGADANVEFNGETALLIAITSGQRCNSQCTTSDCINRREIVKLLLYHGARPNIASLYAANERNNSTVVKLLLDYKLNVDRCTTDGQTALYLAVCEKETRIL